MDNNISYKTIRSGDINVAYLEAGSGDVLVLLHGFPQHSRMWLKVMPILSQRFRVLAPDLRGMGGTSITQDGYNKKNLAEDLRFFLDNLGINNPINLVGYDHGAGVAYAFAAAYSERVTKLGILEYLPPGFGYEMGMQPVPDWQSWQLAFFTVPDIAIQFIQGRERELLAWYFWHWSSNPEAINQEDFEVYVRQLQKPGALRGGFSHFAAVFEDLAYFKKTSTQKLTMPLLALGGAFGAGNYIAQGWHALAENVSGGVIENAGHWLLDEQPQEINNIFLEFFGKQV